MSKLGLKPISGVSRVTIRKSKNVSAFIPLTYVDFPWWYANACAGNLLLGGSQAACRVPSAFGDGVCCVIRIRTFSNVNVNVNVKVPKAGSEGGANMLCRVERCATTLQQREIIIYASGKRKRI
jgi:hypothetical protein